MVFFDSLCVLCALCGRISYLGTGANCNVTWPAVQWPRPVFVVIEAACIRMEGRRTEITRLAID